MVPSFLKLGSLFSFRTIDFSELRYFLLAFLLKSVRFVTLLWKRWSRSITEFFILFVILCVPHFSIDEVFFLLPSDRRIQVSTSLFHPLELCRKCSFVWLFDLTKIGCWMLYLHYSHQNLLFFESKVDFSVHLLEEVTIGMIDHWLLLELSPFALESLRWSDPDSWRT